jgi:autoinducer 2-degrading protein
MCIEFQLLHPNTGSRAEPGCLRFDVLQDKTQSNKFTFYEVYTSSEAIDFHKASLLLF